MIGDQELRIRERAHVIWEREGRPEGRATTHWQMATAEIAAEVKPATAKPAKAAARAAKAAPAPAVKAAEKPAKPRSSAGKPKKA